MKELLFTHADLEGELPAQTAVAVFDRRWSDAEICNSIRNGLMAKLNLELDEIDMDRDGIVVRNDDIIMVLWTASRGQRSVTVIQF